MGRELSNDEIGVERIAKKDVYFLFICDYDPFKNSKIVSNGKPIYTFSMKTLGELARILGNSITEMKALKK